MKMSESKELAYNELVRISGCIPLDHNVEIDALEILEKNKDFTMRGVFGALKKTIKKHNITIDIKKLSLITPYSVQKLKKLI